MRARRSECSVVIGQNETEQAVNHQQQEEWQQLEQEVLQQPRQNQQEIETQQQQIQQTHQQTIPKLDTDKSSDIGASRLSNGSLDPIDQDSAVRVIDLQATLDKQV